MSIKYKKEYRLSDEDERICLQDLELISNDDKIIIRNTKKSHELLSTDQISFVSDALFKTMFCNEGRKKYICKLLSCILDNIYEELMDNTTYYKNELDKDSKTTKSERVDLIVNEYEK